MTRVLGTALQLTLLLLSVSCRTPARREVMRADSAQVAARDARLRERLASADSTSREKPLARWVLPNNLSETSGIALTPDGRLFIHDDELGRVSQVDYRHGVITKEFLIGRQAVRADFEGITVVNDAIFLLASNGKLYEFREGANHERVPYTIHDTQLGRECEFEGVAYDSARGSLLMACKHIHREGPHGALLLYRWNLRGNTRNRLSRMTVPIVKVVGQNHWEGFHPSDITIDPFNGNYLLISAREKGMVEITPDGEVVFTRPIPGDHEQPEGVAITKDSILIVGDEAVHRPAVVTLYRWPL
jgi:hypothetical protein